MERSHHWIPIWLTKLKSGMEYLGQSKEIKQNQEGAENFDIWFGLLFDSLTKILFLEGRLDTSLYIQQILRFA